MFSRKSTPLSSTNGASPPPLDPSGGTIVPPNGAVAALPIEQASSQPTARSARDTGISIEGPRGAESVISPDLTIEGNVQSRGSIRLEGTIQGELHCNSVIVERTGTVTGGIEADEVSVHGKVAGTIRGKSVMLYSTAHVEGDVFHQGIGIEMGTHYDGRLKWTEGKADARPSDRGAVNTGQIAASPSISTTDQNN